jgi:hypothetical protein
VKSYIKKNDVLDYIIEQFNDENATQDINFIMGSEGLPLYKPISFEGTNGTPDEFEFFDEQTYQISKEQAIPLSVPVIQANYINLKNIESTKKINSASWTAVISFLVHANSYVHNKLVFGIEEFRDKMLGKIDILNVKQWDYANVENAAAYTYYTIVTSTGDLVPGELLTINGDIFLEYSLQLEFDVSEGIDYGNQYEIYIAKDKTNNVFNYERILPVEFSFGMSNITKSNQLLRNDSVSENASYHIANRYKVQQNIVDSKSFSLSMTIMKDQTVGNAVEELFKETYNLYLPLNKPFQVQLKYRPIVGNVGQKTFGNAVEQFSHSMIVVEATVQMSNGDDVVFNVTMVPSWNEVA